MGARGRDALLAVNEVAVSMNEENNWLPKSKDTDDIPTLCVPKVCDACGGDMRILFSDVARFPVDGKMKWRLRVRTYCDECKGSVSYRVGGHVIEHGKCVIAYE